MAENGVRMIIATWLFERVVGVERYSDKSECYHQGCCLGGVFCYYPQVGNVQQRTFNDFMNKVVTSTKVLVRKNFIGHVGCDAAFWGKFTGGLEID